MPALTAAEWWSDRKNADPVLTPMSENGVQSQEVSQIIDKYVPIDFGKKSYSSSSVRMKRGRYFYIIYTPANAI